MICMSGWVQLTRESNRVLMITRAKERRNYYMQRRNLQHTPDSSDQAEQVLDELPHHSSSLPLSESEGEDLSEQAEADYEPIPELDRYEDDGVDHEYHQPNPQARRMAEKELLLLERDVLGADPLDQYLQEDSQQQQVRRLRKEFYQVNSDTEQQQMECIDPEQQKGPFHEWVANPSVRSYIKRQLVKFFTHFRENEQPIYFQRLKRMCHNNEHSLLVEWAHLKQANPKLAEWLAMHPLEVLPEYHAVVYALAVKTCPSYKDIVHQAFFKLAGLPISDSIRTLSYDYLGKLVKVRGVVTSCSLTFSQLRKVYYKCQRCGYLKGPFYPNNTTFFTFGACFSCHGRGPYALHTARSVYRNYQILNLQESPNDVAPGRIPRSKEIVLLGDTIDQAKPGDEVSVIGIFTTRYDSRLNIKQGFPVFHTLIEANHIEQVDKLQLNNVIDEAEFEALPKQPNFAEKFYNSIAPSIYGHNRVKRALTLALFGGVEKKNEKQLHRTRGDINVLLLGDPGIAKSQFLKSVQKISPRCVYTTGKGASAVGLTACVRMDPTSKEWRLQAGAMVLADKGICLIDQFDKMTEQDRTSIHEGMEQQTISISKAGIVATLNARCSVIAAANPLGGTYNQQISFRDNVDLSEPILSRFDLLTVIKDRPCQEIDGKLASFVINQHMSNHPYNTEYEQEVNLLAEETQKHKLDKSPDFIKQYIRYAKEKYRPELTIKCSQIIKQLYLRLREYSSQSGGITIVVRHLESMIRLTEAHARMHLRKQTTEADARVAIATMLLSFIDTQRYSTAERIRKAFRYELTLE